MKAPGYWYRPAGVLASALAPIGRVYAAAGWVRRAATAPWRAPIPIVCVGNLTAGGTGKTPVALDLAARLSRRGLAVGFLTRGYGGRLRGPLRVDPALHDAAQVGDEPLLLAAVAGTWVAADRAAGAAAAAAAGVDCLVMDDGLQNPGLAKDQSLVVVDGAVGFGNGCIIPAGPLREPVAEGLARAHAMVIVGEDHTGLAAVVGRLPVLRAHLVPDPAVAAALRGQAVIAFAGIGRPGKFFDTVAGCGARLIQTLGFPDHHRYRPEDIMPLVEAADRSGATLLTTAKDAVRLPPAARLMVRVLPVAIGWQEPERVERLLEEAIRRGRHGG